MTQDYFYYKYYRKKMVNIIKKKLFSFLNDIKYIDLWFISYISTRKKSTLFTRMYIDVILTPAGYCGPRG
jgi:hypothetical protein